LCNGRGGESIKALDGPAASVRPLLPTLSGQNRIEPLKFNSPG
jgi:hypothetical protein